MLTYKVNVLGAHNILREFLPYSAFSPCSLEVFLADSQARQSSSASASPQPALSPFVPLTFPIFRSSVQPRPHNDHRLIRLVRLHPAAQRVRVQQGCRPRSARSLDRRASIPVRPLLPFAPPHLP